MKNIRVWAFLILIVGSFLGYFLYASQYKVDSTFFEKSPFRLGLDLNGGTRLVYTADTSGLNASEISDAMSALRDTIEKRVNAFGVSEPIVQVEIVGGDDRLSVELPGITDIDEAQKQIGQTPMLEFRLYNENVDTSKLLSSATLDEEGNLTLKEDANRQELVNMFYQPTGLTGRYLRRSTVGFDMTNKGALINLEFNDEGKKLFADITRNNIGKQLAIFLDGEMITDPTINSAITDGKAVITGVFTKQKAQEIVSNLNSGALPVPIALLSTQTIGASLGAQVLNAGIYAGLVALITIAIFLILYYRLPGLIAVVALILYVILNLIAFKFLGVTLTAAGIAGFILSVGMAVDANILIFERTKEELKAGKNLQMAVKEGFDRAWTSIRDSNLSSIITSIILYYTATTSMVKGFALVFCLGVLISAFTAVTISRTLLLSIGLRDSKFGRFLFNSGLNK
jgi:protein-export membrane protein SecD